jgi:thioredoxin 2
MADCAVAWSFPAGLKVIVMAETTRIRCPKCGIINKLPLARIQAGERPVCGRCKTPLDIDEEPFEVTDATFAQEIERSPMPVVVDLWAPWCGPCRRVAPIIDAVAAEMAGRMRFAKLNVDDCPHTAARLGVASIPTLLVYKDGREVHRMVGVRDKAELLERLGRFV